MGILRFRVAEKQEIVFSTAYVEFIRSMTATKLVDIPYSNGTGQTVVSGDILYLYLTPGVDGYIRIVASSNQTLSGSGLLNVSMTHTVSSTQANQNINFSFDSSPITIQASYNSKPIAEDIIKDVDNRTTYIFLNTDFTDAYEDFDSDSLSEVAVFGIVTGYELNGSPYVEGEWIPMTTISAGNFQYVSLSQDAYYEKDNTWKAKDINGNISE